MEALYQNILLLEWEQMVMWLIGGLLIYLAIKHDMEPTLLLPMGFGAILSTCPSRARSTVSLTGSSRVRARFLPFTRPALPMNFSP